jgi:flavorubredoxin
MRMKSALVIYSTKGGKTEAIARCISEGLGAAGVEVQLRNVTEVEGETDLDGFDAYVIGSATYHHEMMKPARQLLALAENVDLKGRPGGAFGAFGWSGEATDVIFETMGHTLGMDMVSEPLRIQSVTAEEDCETAREYGRLVAARLPS